MSCVIKFISITIYVSMQIILSWKFSILIYDVSSIYLSIFLNLEPIFTFNKNLYHFYVIKRKINVTINCVRYSTVTRPNVGGHLELTLLLVLLLK